jgi:RNA polymerase sigma-70 factor (ECF subfamily)
MFEAGRAAWPGVQVAQADFVAYLARLPTDRVSAPGTDIYIACAASRGDPQALRAINDELVLLVRRYVSRHRGGDDFADEILQTLREKLFVGAEGSPPRIATYLGRGPLGAWLRMAMVRTAHNLRRNVRNEGAPDDQRLAAPAPDPETQLLKTHYAREFEAALASTLRALTLDERNVLRHYYLDGLTLAAIGAMYGVHASTITRWISESHRTICSETRRLLEGRLRKAVEPVELQSLLNLVQSQLDVRLSQLLRKSAV